MWPVSMMLILLNQGMFWLSSCQLSCSWCPYSCPHTHLPPLEFFSTHWCAHHFTYPHIQLYTLLTIHAFPTQRIITPSHAHPLTSSLFRLPHTDPPSPPISNTHIAHEYSADTHSPPYTSSLTETHTNSSTHSLHTLFTTHTLIHNQSCGLVVRVLAQQLGGCRLKPWLAQTKSL